MAGCPIGSQATKKGSILSLGERHIQSVSRRAQRLAPRHQRHCGSEHAPAHLYGAGTGDRWFLACRSRGFPFAPAAFQLMLSGSRWLTASIHQLFFGELSVKSTASPPLPNFSDGSKM